jgi:hypothetical protein
LQIVFRALYIHTLQTPLPASAHALTPRPLLFFFYERFLSVCARAQLACQGLAFGYFLFFDCVWVPPPPFFSSL